MVRLKGMHKERSLRQYFTFQFQMVRLKGHRGEREDGLANVISIPNGSIKRGAEQGQLDRIVKFQFQMVRLKDEDDPLSILAQSLFQFQMVRLKVSSVFALSSRYFYFNSKWFD